MADDNLDVLLRTTDNTIMSLEQSKKFNNTKRKINGICKALSMNTQKYDPQKTVENIASYITSTNKLDRILYSEISNYVYSLEMSQRGVFATMVCIPSSRQLKKYKIFVLPGWISGNIFMPPIVAFHEIPLVLRLQVLSVAGRLYSNLYIL